LSEQFLPSLNLKIITIKGTFDAVTSMQVDKKVLPVIEQEKSNVILDLSNVDYLSSVGIVCLAQYLVLLTDKKRVLKFVKPPDRVYDTLTLIAFAKNWTCMISSKQRLVHFDKVFYSCLMNVSAVLLSNFLSNYATRHQH
jgi:anti-anti-sigma factor